MTPQRIVESLLDELPVTQQDRVIKGGDMVCPHCKEIIHEKGIAERGGKTIHGKCGGVIKMPGPSPEDLAYFKQHWGVDLVGESRAPNIRVLKDNRRTLTPEERAAVIAAGGVWPDGNPGIWKAELRGETWYVSNTHRVYQADKDLKTAIRKFKEIVEPSS